MMSIRRLRWLPWVLVGVITAIAAEEFVVTVQNGHVAGQAGGPAVLLEGALLFVLPLSFACVGAFVLTRRPGNRIGWLMIAVGLGFALGTLASDYPRLDAVTHQPTRPDASFIAWVDAWIWNLQLIALLLLLLVFPTGHLPGPRWRFVLWTGVVSLLGLGVLFAVERGSIESVPFNNPYGLVSVPNVITGAGGVVVLASLGAAALSLVLRFRSARGVVRQQMKWFAFGAVVAVFFEIATYFFSWSGVVGVLALLAVTSLPVFMGIAILRYRLYDIDLLINRTLVYGSLTASLAGLFVATILVLQALSRAIVGQDSQLAVALSTLLIAALFTPWRRRVQTFIDRRFYRRKYDAARILTDLQGTLRDEVDLDRISREIVGVVHETVQAGHVSLWLP